MISRFGNPVACITPGRVTNDIATHSLHFVACGVADMAVQPGLGLLSNRRARNDPPDRPHPGPTRTHLRVSAPCARISPPPVLLSGLPQPAEVVARCWKLARGASRRGELVSGRPNDRYARRESSPPAPASTFPAVRAHTLPCPAFGSTAADSLPARRWTLRFQPCDPAGTPSRCSCRGRDGRQGK